MEYNRNNIQKIEHFFSYLRIKGKKRWKNVYLCYFSIPFIPHCIANKRFSYIIKIYIF